MLEDNNLVDQQEHGLLQAATSLEYLEPWACLYMGKMGQATIAASSMWQVLCVQ